MAKNIITATDVRNDFFNLINLVAKTREPIYIKKDNEVMVKLEAVGEELNSEWEETKRILDETRGMWAHRSEKEIRAKFKAAELKTMEKIRARNW